MKYFLVIILFVVFACGKPQKQFGYFPHSNSIVIDGQSEDWVNISSLNLSSADSTITEGKGTWTDDDLDLTVQTAWDEEYLYVAATWKDNVFDVKNTPLDSVIWNGHPDGLRRDRMYYYDNLAIRLRLPNYIGFWLTPGNLENNGYQHGELINPVTAINQVDESTFFIEAKILWKEMVYTPIVGDSISFQVIASDSDHPSYSLLEKNDATKYILWTQDAIIDD